MRLTLLALVVLSTGFVAAACGGSSGPADPIALAGLILDQSPEEDLPKGTKIDEDLVFVDGNEDEGEIAAYYVTFTAKGLLSDAYIYVFRTEEDAQASLDTQNDFYEDFGMKAPKDKAAARCAWDDEVLEAACLARTGPAFIETFTYLDDDPDVDEDDAEAAGLALTKALAGYVEKLAKDAHKLDKAPLKLLAALMASTQPPNAPDGASFQDPTIVADADDDLMAQFDRANQVSWYTGTGWTLYLMTFANKNDATEYRDKAIDAVSAVKVESDGSTCARSDDGQLWVCLSGTGEALAYAIHRNTSADLDRDAARYAKDAADYAKTLHSGELPRKPRPGAKVPPGSPTVPSSPTAVKTAVQTPTPPGLSAINAGTWTFRMKVLSNTCAGSDPAPGQIVTLEYEFTESGGDDLISAGELFQIDQTLPGARQFGFFTMALPKLTLQLPVGSGSSAGTGKVTFEFGARDSAAVTYAEEYSDCKITAITN